eukprot:4719476-Alexandrium_andersonii.AAC.1
MACAWHVACRALCFAFAAPCLASSPGPSILVLRPCPGLWRAVLFVGGALGSPRGIHPDQLHVYCALAAWSFL